MTVDMMETIGEVPDIPKAFTAISEWLACVVYLLASTRARPRPRQCAVLAGGLVALLIVQHLIGIVPLWLWIPGMVLAVAIMHAMMRAYRPINRATSAYWLARAFVLAEFVAALEWQLYVFMVRNMGMPAEPWCAAVFLAVVYAVQFLLAYVLELRHDDADDAAVFLPRLRRRIRLDRGGRSVAACFRHIPLLSVGLMRCGDVLCGGWCGGTCVVVSLRYPRVTGWGGPLMPVRLRCRGGSAIIVAMWGVGWCCVVGAEQGVHRRSAGMRVG